MVGIASLMALLMLVLYLPSAHAPEHFVMRLRIEHAQLVKVWSSQHAEQILSRTLAAQASAAQFSPAPNMGQAPDPRVVHSTVGSEMAAVSTRLLNSPYFRSIDALLLLASYRLFTLLEWLPWLGLFCLAALIDGGVMRSIKARQFVQHDPEMFALCICMAVVLACATVIALVLPARLPTLLLPAVPIGMAILAGGALRNFHQSAAS